MAMTGAPMHAVTEAPERGNSTFAGLLEMKFSPEQIAQTAFGLKASIMWSAIECILPFIERQTPWWVKLYLHLRSAAGSTGNGLREPWTGGVSFEIGYLSASVLLEAATRERIGGLGKATLCMARAVTW